jgi:hypothetical protein
LQLRLYTQPSIGATDLIAFNFPHWVSRRDIKQRLRASSPSDNPNDHHHPTAHSQNHGPTIRLLLSPATIPILPVSPAHNRLWLYTSALKVLARQPTNITPCTANTPSRRPSASSARNNASLSTCAAPSGLLSLSQKFIRSRLRSRAGCGCTGRDTLARSTGAVLLLLSRMDNANDGAAAPTAAQPD